MTTHAHPHAHEHPHEHPHQNPPVVSENPTAGRGLVVVDIGGDVGALVLHTDADMTGLEIEISRVGEARTGKHVAVLPRPVGDTVDHSAVYGDLREGRWQLWLPDGRPGQVVEVVGGVVTECWWAPPN